MKGLFKYLLYTISIIVVLFVLGFATGSVEIISDKATVYVDEKTNIYYSPLSLNQNKVTELNLKKTNLINAETLGFKMDEEGKQNEYFQQEGRSLSGKLLEKIGILPKLRERIDSNGNWRY